MNQNDFEINYWGEDFKNIHFNPRTPKKTVKQKLLIVSSFIFILAIIPVVIFGITNLSSNNTQKISSATQIQKEPTQTPIPTPSAKPTFKINKASKVEVINNDSYWKISKRQCGTGKYYLSIRNQNAAKALHKGDFVEVSCSL